MKQIRISKPFCSPIVIRHFLFYKYKWKIDESRLTATKKVLKTTDVWNDCKWKDKEIILVLRSRNDSKDSEPKWRQVMTDTQSQRTDTSMNGGKIS